MFKTEGDDIIVNKHLIWLLTIMLGGGGVFTGYATKTETVHLTPKEITEIVNNSLDQKLSVVETKLNRIDIRTAGMSVMQNEYGRRLNTLERIHEDRNGN